MIADSVRLALTNLKHRGLRSLLTMVGIFIGIAAVVSLISLGNGLQSAIMSQFNVLSTDRLVVQNAEAGFGPPGSTAVRKLTEHDLQLIESVQGTDLVAPRILRIARVEYNDVRRFEFLASVPETQEQIDFVYDSFSVDIEQGRRFTASERRKVVLGHDFTDEDLYGKAIRAGTTIRIEDTEFEVVGILEEGSSFQINGAVILTETDMKDLLEIGDEIDFIIVQVTDTEQIESVADTIERRLRKDRNLQEGEEDFSVQTPTQSLTTINTILNVINLVVTGIAAISLLVGGIGIANTMFTSVLERTKEIGTMKAVGARNANILEIFLSEAALLGLIGGIIGAALGIALAFGVAAIANASFGTTILEVAISYPLIIGSIIFSCGVGVISGLIPALRASHLKPTEALRA